MHFKHYENPYSGLAQYVNCAAANPGADAGMYDASEQYKLSTDLAGFVYLARQKTLSYQRCMKEVTYSQSTYIQQVGIGSCMYNVEPLYVFDRDI